MSETARQEWKAQLATRPGAYHRVERVGAHPTEEPVAVVKDARLTQAFAMLPDIARALSELERATFELSQRVDAGAHLVACHAVARQVLDDLRKVKAPL